METDTLNDAGESNSNGNGNNNTVTDFDDWEEFDDVVPKSTKKIQMVTRG